MGYRLVVSKDAHEDINDIVAYIAQELKKPRAAAGFLDDVEKSYRRVMEQPRIYAQCNDERLAGLGYRKIAIKNYLILYRVDEEQKVVYIARVVYGGRDFAALL